MGGCAGRDVQVKACDSGPAMGSGAVMMGDGSSGGWVSLENCSSEQFPRRL